MTQPNYATSRIYRMGQPAPQSEDERFKQLQYEAAKRGMLVLRRDDCHGVKQEFVDQEIREIRKGAT